MTGVPRYFERFGEPAHPDDLRHHRCLRFRIGNDSVYRWEFDKDGEAVAIAASGPLMLDDSRSMVSLLLAGVQLMYAPEPLVAPLVRAGQDRYAIEDWCSFPGPGFHIYYSSRRQLPAGLRLLTDLIRDMQPIGP